YRRTAAVHGGSVAEGHGDGRPLPAQAQVPVSGREQDPSPGDAVALLSHGDTEGGARVDPFREIGDERRRHVLDDQDGKRERTRQAPTDLVEGRGATGGRP